MLRVHKWIKTTHADMHVMLMVMHICSATPLEPPRPAGRAGAPLPSAPHPCLAT